MSESISESISESRSESRSESISDYAQRPSEYPLDFNYAYGGPIGEAAFRSIPEDFVVEEQLGFVADGEGEHLLLHLQKRNQNTRWVAEQLADIAGVQPLDIGYCGMKDRRAVTRQWFSVYLPRRELNLAAVEQIEGVTLLEHGRHRRKLRRGEHAANRFQITLRDCSADNAQLDERLKRIAELGVPNYFGEQRFGHDGGNLLEFASRFVGVDGDSRAGARRGKGSKKSRRPSSNRGIYLSAGRSYLFNRILSSRVAAGSWCQPIAGETVPTGALWGRGRLNGSQPLNSLEQSELERLPGWGDALEHTGLSQQRRKLILKPSDFSWHFDDAKLVIALQLEPGCFATSVLRELTRLITPEACHDIVQPINLTGGNG